MIYQNKPLLIRILYENTHKNSVFGIYRPQAYIKEAGNYCTVCRIDILKQEIKQGKNIVINAILEAPVGFGEHLTEGTLLSLRSGLDEEGRAIVLEVINYLDELDKSVKKKNS